MRSNLILFVLVLVLVNQNYIEYDDEGGNCRNLANNAPSFRIPHSDFPIPILSSELRRINFRKTNQKNDGAKRHPQFVIRQSSFVIPIRHSSFQGFPTFLTTAVRADHTDTTAVTA